MHPFTDINTHGGYDLVIYFVVNAGVSALPPVKPDSSAAYQWIYGFLNAILGRLKEAKQAAQPPLK